MGITRSVKRRGAWLGRVTLSAALAASLVGVPAAAFAAPGTDSTSVIAQSVAESNASDPFAWSTLASADSLRATADLPAKFDLRDKGAVTPVKLQNPWGSCWAFAVAAASETSILSEAKDKGIDIDTPDLSERHLTWFTYQPLPEGDDSNQGGEGMISTKEGVNAPFTSGGMMIYGTSLFSSGIGPVPEEDVPYQGKEGKVDSSGIYYSSDDDWSVDESQRFRQGVELQESFQLPSPGDCYESDGSFIEGGQETLAAANTAIKEQLQAGHGVAIAFMADQSRPGQITNTGYMNPQTWAHYTYDKVPITHAVTIVGWDDSYSKENFGNPNPATGEVDSSHQPPGDGAWIVKNSWGSKDGGFPNEVPGGWGIDGSGYFYLSYYDKTISKPETFDFDVESIVDERESYSIYQYDYMPSQSTAAQSDTRQIQEANVFASAGGQTVRKLTCETTRPNTEVTFEVYQLDKDATTPVQGEKLATVKATYDFGGFHTIDLGDQAFSLPEGELFSVVLTQKCLDDGNYYVSFDTGFDKNTWEKIYDQNYEKYHDTIFANMVETLSDAVWEREYTNAKNDGKTEEEARAAATAYVEDPAKVEEIKQLAEEQTVEQVKNMSPAFYSKSVVNEGESFLFAAPDEDPGADLAWRDFSKDARDIDALAGTQIDNFPIKAYAYEDPAADEDLKKLENNAKWAKDLMYSAVASKDGSDVHPSKYWVPTDVFTELETRTKQAEDLIASDKPTQLNIDKALFNLEKAMTDFRNARKAGTEGTYDPEQTAMYRLYNPNSGEHFYTASTAERDATVAAGWNDEGIGWIAPDESTTPVYRLYSGTDHHYTTSTVERDYLVSVGWDDEGVGWYSDDAQGVPLHREFNPNVDPSAPFNNSGSHNYTTSEAERDYLVSIGWRYEGVGWYGMK